DQLHSELGRVLGEAQVLRDAGSGDQLDNEHGPVERLPPVASDILQRLRQDPTAELFSDETERDALRGELTNLLGEDQAARLGDGDDSVLEEQLADRLDRLYMAKAYLQSEPALANSMAMEHVLDEIANEEIEVQRHHHVEADGEKGVTHG
ncbi:MAG: hypothetical protein L3J16_08060, partial [Anaerolineales bacterium]|nr:hypothetical protein [Anaerolineales bacterium]